LTEGIAAIAGFEGVKALTEHLQAREEAAPQTPSTPA
jgi:hypothetical protein